MKPVKPDLEAQYASVFTHTNTLKTTGDIRSVIYATEHFPVLHYT